MATEARQTQPSHDEHEAPKFDREISFWGTLWTGVGILLVTLLGMIVAWTYSEHLRDSILARDLPLTAVEEAAQVQVREINRQRLQTERRPLPALEWPLYAAPPPQPQVQVQPWTDMQSFLLDQRPILEDYGWVNRDAGLARVPISRAMSEIAAEGIPLALPPLPQEPAPDEAAVPTVTLGAPRGPEGR